MGVGQHYNMAAYIGEKFVLEETDVKERSRKNLLNVLVVKKFLEIEEKDLSKEDVKKAVDNCIVKMPAEQIFTGDFICPEKEKELGFNEIEKKFLEKHRGKSMNNIDVTEIETEFFSLHEARNVENYLALRNDIIEIYKISESMNKFFENLFKKSLLLKKITIQQNKNKAKFHLKTIYELLRSNATKKGLNSEVKNLFNDIYPLYQKTLNLKYQSLSWLGFTGESDLGFGIGGGFVIDISKKFYWDFLGGAYMPDDIKLFLKDLVIVILDKKNFIIGFSKKQIKKIEKYNTGGVPDIVYVSEFLRNLNIARTLNHLIFSDTSYKNETIDELVNHMEFYKNLLNFYKELKQDFN